MSRFMKCALILLTILAVVGGCSGCSSTPLRVNSLSSNITAMVDAVTLQKEPTQVMVYKFIGDIDPEWAKQMEAGFKNPEVKAILMWIESGGGTITDAQLLTHNMRLLRTTYDKPLYVYSERALFSGAYYAAVEADEIILAPSGMAGSIGVRLQRVDATAFDSALGLKVYTFVTGIYKAAGDPHTEMTEAEAAYLQYLVNQAFQDFLNQVMSNRGPQFVWKAIENNGIVSNSELGIQLAQQMLKNFADGRIFNAATSEHYGFVDRVMFFDELVLKFKDQGCTVVYEDGTPVGLFYQEWRTSE